MQSKLACGSHSPLREGPGAQDPARAQRAVRLREPVYRGKNAERLPERVLRSLAHEMPGADEDPDSAEDPGHPTGTTRGESRPPWHRGNPSESVQPFLPHAAWRRLLVPVLRAGAALSRRYSPGQRGKRRFGRV